MEIHFTPKWYPSLTVPNGPLPEDMRAQACWTYVTRAMAAREIVGRGPEDQVLYDDEAWMDFRPDRIAKAVAVEYGIESPDEFLKFMLPCKSACRQLGYPRIPFDVAHPKRFLGSDQ